MPIARTGIVFGIGAPTSGGCSIATIAYIAPRAHIVPHLTIRAARILRASGRCCGGLLIQALCAAAVRT